jgi:EAL domain-containing protein (putative c-di-GMP-specific phosphodiesterase class I)
VDSQDNQIRPVDAGRSSAICASVQAALRQNRLLLAYQPVVCARTGKIDYFECLLRMRDLEGGIVAGGEFIRPIEELGLIGLIDDYVLELAVRELTNHPVVTLGLNVSGSTACAGSWLKSLVPIARSRPDIARRLVIEITETTALSNLGEAACFVDTLQRAGCRVALDDFGAGYTSLQHLEILPVDTVKIDGSFVRNLANSTEKRGRLRDLLGLISGFGCATVAEGVESVADEAVARAEGFGFLQGYHLGPPRIERAWLSHSTFEPTGAPHLYG